jgi:hypothetical protein
MLPVAHLHAVFPKGVFETEIRPEIEMMLNAVLQCHSFAILHP